MLVGVSDFAESVRHVRVPTEHSHGRARTQLVKAKGLSDGRSGIPVRKSMHILDTSRVKQGSRMSQNWIQVNAHGKVWKDIEGLRQLP